MTSIIWHFNISLSLLQVCFSGYDTNSASTLNYACPHPIKGLYLTLQKTQPTPGDPEPYAFTISEIFVHAFKVDF